MKIGTTSFNLAAIAGMKKETFLERYKNSAASAEFMWDKLQSEIEKQGIKGFDHE